MDNSGPTVKCRDLNDSPVSSTGAVAKSAAIVFPSGNWQSFPGELVIFPRGNWQSFLGWESISRPIVKNLGSIRRAADILNHFRSQASAAMRPDAAFTAATCHCGCCRWSGFVASRSRTSVVPMASCYCTMSPTSDLSSTFVIGYNLSRSPPITHVLRLTSNPQIEDPDFMNFNFF